MNCRFKKGVVKIVFTLLSLFLLNSSLFAMSIQVAPQRFIFRIDRPVTEEVIVTNTSQQQIRVKIYPEMVPKQISEEYLGEWVVIYPRVLSLEPGQKRLVRFSVRPPENLENGEYRSLLFFEELPPPNESTTSQGKLELNFQLLTKLGINLYGQFGKIIHQGKVEDVKVNFHDQKLLIQANFINQGNAHLLLTTELMILDMAGQLVKKLMVPIFPVHRSSTEVFEQWVDFFDSGKYRLKMIFKQEDVVICEYSESFTI